MKSLFKILVLNYLIFLMLGCTKIIYNYKNLESINQGYVIKMKHNSKVIYYELGCNFPQSFYPPIDDDDNLDSLNFKSSDSGWERIIQKIKYKKRNNLIIYSDYYNHSDTLIIGDKIITTINKLPITAIVINRFETSGISYFSKDDLFITKYIKDSIISFNNKPAEYIHLFEYKKIEKNDSIKTGCPIIVGFSKINSVPVYYKLLKQEYTWKHIDEVYAIDFVETRMRKKIILKLLM